MKSIHIMYWGLLIMNVLSVDMMTADNSKKRDDVLNQPYITLAFLPTPIQKLERLTTYLQGPYIFIKRDDQTGLACGGNKTRKLEYLCGNALQHDIDTLVTAGALQSNHCRQTAAAAAQLGLRCQLLLNSKKPDDIQGNVLLDNLFGAQIHWKEELHEPRSLQELAEQVKKAGHKPYIIPYGGSNAFGVCGYIHAMFEFVEQQKKLDKKVTHIFVASCSGATQVGLVIGAKLAGFDVKIIGISVDYTASQHQQYVQEHLDLAQATAQLLNLNMTFRPEDFVINYDYADGYGIVGDLERYAIKTMAQQEGILLDPVYSGRAFGAVQDMIIKKELSQDDTILFWHTGGIPSIFCYGNELL